MKIKAVTILAIVLASLTVIGIVLGVALLPDGAEEHVCTYTTIGNTATCEQGGEKTQACSVCGDRRVIPIPALGHDMKYTDKAATCTEDGMHSGICLRCNYATFEPHPAFGHNYMISLETSSTCTAGGVRVEICLNCNDEKRTPFDPVSHDTVAVAEKAATCLDTGYAAYEYCNNCSYTTRGDDFPALGHDMTFNERDATCTVDGLYEGACSRCDHTVTESRTALGHNYVLSREESATCTEGGERVEICERCGEERRTQVDPKGHNLFNVPAKAATCTENGYAAYEKCKNCSYSTKGTVIAALGHREAEQVVSPATCANEGTKRVYCTRCDLTLQTQTLPKTGHNLKDKIDFQKATCTEPGYTYYKVCDTCDYSEYEVSPALGHGEEVRRLIQEASCVNEGRVVYTCARCNAVLRNEISSKLPHSYKLVNSEQPTCLEDGWGLYKCNNGCESTERRILASLGHNMIPYQEDDYNDQACPAFDNKKCTRCEYREEVLHELRGEGYVDPTCEEEGHNFDIFCWNCGKIIKYGDVIPALGHDYVYDYRDIEDCNKGGTIYYTCQRCGDEGSSYSSRMEHVLIPHAFTSSTCTEPGNYGYYTCERCSYNTYKESEILGHNVVDNVCTRCGFKFSVTSLDHTQWFIDGEYLASPTLQHIYNVICTHRDVNGIRYDKLCIGSFYDADLQEFVPKENCVYLYSTTEQVGKALYRGDVLERAIYIHGGEDIQDWELISWLLKYADLGPENMF